MRHTLTITPILLGTLAVSWEDPNWNYQPGHQNREAQNPMLDDLTQTIHRLANKAVNYDKMEITHCPQENPGEFLESLSQALQKYLC